MQLKWVELHKKLDKLEMEYAECLNLVKYNILNEMQQSFSARQSTK